jgi:protein arginine kinase activator
MVPRPSQCQGCTQPYSTYFTLVSGGKAESFGCCQACPVVTSPVAGGLLPSAALGWKLHVPMPSGRGRCPACGFRWQDFERTHRIGCPACYQAHTEQVLATIARLQPGMAHQGRRPQVSVAERQAKLSALQALLTEAVKEEDYESAAALRDQIAALEAGLTSPSA